MPADCAAARRVTASAVSGVHRLPTTDRDAWCDMRADGRSFTLVSSFEQPAGLSMAASVNEQDYIKYFLDGSWIQGNTQGPALSDRPRQDGAFHVRGMDWAQVMTVGKRYYLRQRALQMFSNGSVKAEFDVAYLFRFNGYLRQDDAPLAGRVWRLSDREVLADTTKINWAVDVTEPIFYLPFTPNITGTVYHAEGGYSEKEAPLPDVRRTQRRYGSAGITYPGNTRKDPAGSYAPFLHPSSGQHAAAGIFYAHQNADAGYPVMSSVNQNTTVFLSYWVAPLD